MLPKMPDIAWLRDGGCIAAAQRTDNGAAMLERKSPQDRGYEEERRWRDEVGSVMPGGSDRYMKLYYLVAFRAKAEQDESVG